MNRNLKRWIKAAGIRAAKTAAQAALGGIGASELMGEVQWVLVGSAALLAAVVSVITCFAGIPEVDDGASIIQLSDHAQK